MNRKVAACIRRYGMIDPGDMVWVALSGGADSVSLLHVLAGLRESLGFSLGALHLNHNLRGAESRRDELFVRRLCAEMDIPLRVGSADIAKEAKKRGLSVEACAREARYAFFHRHGKDGKAATAHTLTDNGETILLNLIRGTGLRGLCGIPPVRGNIIRPLLGCTRGDVEAYCALHRLRYVTDSTNRSDSYTRNRLRHRVMPLLLEENPRLEETLGQMGSLLRQDADWLDAQAAEARRLLAPEGNRLDRRGFLSLPAPLRFRVLRDLLGEAGLGYDHARLELMEQAVNRGRGGVRLTKLLELRVTPRDFALGPVEPKAHRLPPPSGQSIQLSLPMLGETVEAPPLSGKKVILRVKDAVKYKKTINNYQNHLKNALDCDKIEKYIFLRHARPADKIRPVGRGCTKTHKNLWSEAGVSPERRRRCLLLEGMGRVLWSEMFGPDESVAAGPDTPCVLTIEVMEE